MAQTRGRGGERPGGRSRTRATLPVVEITSREDMAVMLVKHARVMREYARRYLGRDASDDDVEDVVERTADVLLAIEQPRYVHGLRFAMRVLAKECRDTLHRRQLQLDPVDSRLGRLTGPVRAVLDRLGPRSRQIILDVAHGKTVAEIAHEEHRDPAVVGIRLVRARKRALELLREMGHTLSAFVIVAPWRLRGSFTRIAQGVAHDAVPQSAAATMLVPLIASALLGLGSFGATSAPRDVTAAALQPSAALPSVVAPAPPSTVRVGFPLPGSPEFSASVDNMGQSAVGLLHGAAAETPDDVILTAVATPADGRPVIVATGRGRGCNCQVLMRSLDGGATWAARDGPPADAVQLALPPTYPDDPRIFAGVDPFIVGSSPYMAAAFSEPFEAITGLPGGLVAVSAHMDDGDPRLFSAAVSGVWSIALGSAAVPREEIDYSGAAVAQGSVAALATPSPGAGSPAVLAWAPTAAIAPGASGLPSLASTMFRCPVGDGCAATAALSRLPWHLTVQGSNVVAYTRTTVFSSADGGRSFESLRLPAGAAGVWSIALVGRAPWVTYTLADGRVGVARHAAGGEWIDVAGSDRSLRTHLGSLIAVDGRRVIAAFGDAGYRCALVTRSGWFPRCPIS